MVRLAVAVWPPPEVRSILAAIDRPPMAGVHWATPEQWMVRVRPLGHVAGKATATRLAAALRADLAGAPAVECVLGTATRRLAAQWLGVPISGLDDLAAAVFDATEGLVPVTHPQPFRAHLVLARGRVPKELAGQPVDASWTARSVSLVADRSSPRGARYENLAAIPLEA